MYGEWSELQKNTSQSEQQSCKGWRKGDLAMISYKFFSQTKQIKSIIGWKILHRQLILIVDIPGWPAINVCHTFRNTMLMEIRKIMITAISGEEHDWSPSVIGEQFLRTMWLYILPFSLDFNLAEYLNWKIRRLRRVARKTLRWLPIKAAFVVSKVSSRWNQLIWSDIQADAWNINLLKKKRKPQQWWIEHFFDKVESNEWD